LRRKENVRRFLGIAAANLVLAASVEARAQSAGDSNSLSNELLEIWNRSYVEENPNVDTNVYDLFELGGYGDTSTPEPAPSNRFTAPDGMSLTPNLDRLMQRYSPTARSGAATNVGSRSSSPRIDVGLSPSFSAYTSSGSTIDTGRHHGDRRGGRDGHRGGHGGHGSRDGHRDGRDGHHGDRDHGDKGGKGHDDKDGHHPGDGCAPTPEPGTLVLLGLAAGSAGLRLRRRRARA
jgi:hypothetical protein